MRDEGWQSAANYLTHFARTLTSRAYFWFGQYSSPRAQRPQSLSLTIPPLGMVVLQWEGSERIE